MDGEHVEYKGFFSSTWYAGILFGQTAHSQTLGRKTGLSLQEVYY